MNVIERINMLKKMVKEAERIVTWQADIYTALHNLDAGWVVSGVFPVGRGGTGLSTIALGGILYASALNILSRLAPTAANQVLRSTAANALQFAALLATDIPNLPASKITSGRFPVNRLPAMTDEKIWKGTGGNVEEVDMPTGVPSGIIVMWHGTIASIPSGWVICDGNNGTPNLLQRFVQGVATAATNPGATGGATSKTTSGHKHDMGLRIEQGDYRIVDGPSPWGNGQLWSGDTHRCWLEYGASPTPRTDWYSSLTKSKTDSISDIRPKYYDVAFLMKT